jgi:flavin-dependent dehydrogenase
MNYDIAIIGGGLSGLISSIELSRAGFSVLLIEKKTYPFHRVCGEYVSNEVLEYLNSIGFDPFHYSAKRIDEFELSSVSGLKSFLKLPLGGFSLSRFTFDQALYEIAIKNSVTFCLNDSVENVSFLENEDFFTLKTQKGTVFNSKIVIGAHGKRSVIDKNLDRDFIKKRSSYMAVKCHYEGDFPENLVSLHNFKGGYCGLSKVETGHVNVCYLTYESNLKKYKDIKSMELGILSKNPHLKKVFEDWNPVFKTPLSISQIYFHEKNLVENHALMVGDAAGLIYPLCGNGMAMAIHGAVILSDLIKQYFLDKKDRTWLESRYQYHWKKQFSSRLRMGGLLQNVFGEPFISGTAVKAIKYFPAFGTTFIKSTHGEIIKTNKLI